MDPVVWQHRPTLRAPVLVAAWEGWNDAADAASLAANFIAEQLGAEDFATLDPEEFHDFTSTRPHVRLVEDGSRVIDWPEATFQAATLEGRDHDIVFLLAHEPQLRWKAYCAALLGVARELGITLFLSLGALAGDVPHTRPVPLTGTTGDPDLVRRLGLIRSRYEGPTGIVGVVHDAMSRAGIPSASLWASVPHYIAQTPSPLAALALVERASTLLGVPVDVTDLQEAADEYRGEIDEVVSGDDEAVSYVAQLEEAYDEARAAERAVDPFDEGRPDPGTLRLAPADELAAEAERFLRGQ